MSKRLASVALALSFTLMLASPNATSGDQLTLSYSGQQYLLPPNPVAIGSAGGKDNVLIIKYSEKSGKDYISLSRGGDLETGACSYPDFFRSTLDSQAEDSCANSAIDAFRRIFVADAETDVWEVSGHLHYYFRTADHGTFVFSVIDDHAIIVINTDFMEEQELRHALTALAE
ncbi:hypothetical protein [Thioalkalivibrio sp. ALR17-21]|uniref:hypothetical protein n=1 Tax=Thioalkalivibrio sp. ALR17-21 TaxID=1269813 RepID=UPI001E452099|nr:hypothetical protein [Thioalkalivibrio sp. ALR17-21]